MVLKLSWFVGSFQRLSTLLNPCSSIKITSFAFNEGFHQSFYSPRLIIKKPTNESKRIIEIGLLDTDKIDRKERKSSSSSFELFIVCNMQEDVYTMRKRSRLVCESSDRLGPPRRVNCLDPPPLCHVKIEASSKVSCPRAQQASLPACSSHYLYFAERQAGKLWIPFFSLLVRLRLSNEPQVYRLRSGSSKHYAITPVRAKVKKFNTSSTKISCVQLENLEPVKRKRETKWPRRRVAVAEGFGKKVKEGLVTRQRLVRMRGRAALAEGWWSGKLCTLEVYVLDGTVLVNWGPLGKVKMQQDRQF